MNNDMIPVGTTVHISPKDTKWEWNGGDLISRSDIKDHISELLLVYSGAELANAILDAIDNAPAAGVEPQLLGTEPHFTSVSTGYATYAAEDIRICDYCKHHNASETLHCACRECINYDRWEQK